MSVTRLLLPDHPSKLPNTRNFTPENGAIRALRRGVETQAPLDRRAALLELESPHDEQWREAIPLKRGGTPTDVANACVFLGSELSAYITGQTLHVCGGMLT